MENSAELKHYGILGQKWGIRRYQNPDGTLTEAGKKKYRYQNPDGSLTDEGREHYMEAARKGKLDVKKLSNADLDMINTRFAKEKNYEKNVQDYTDSLFSTKLKKAIVSRISGNGGGGKKGGGGESTIGKLLAMPIQAAFKGAFSDNGGGKNGGGGGGGDEGASKLVEKGSVFVKSYKPTLNANQTIKALRNSDVERGKSALKNSNYEVSSSAGGRMGTYDSTSSGNSATEKKLRERREARDKTAWSSYTKTLANEKKKDHERAESLKSNKLVFTSKGWMYQSEWTLEYTHFSIKRSEGITI